MVFFSFPGLRVGDNVLSLVKLMTSKNPDSDITALVALDGGYNPCDNSSFFSVPESKRRRKRSVYNGCDEGFVADTANGYCYIVVEELTYFDDGETTCQNSYDADVVQFENDSYVDGLIGLLNSGEKQNLDFFIIF